jgi:hypothetical protein
MIVVEMAKRLEARGRCCRSTTSCAKRESILIILIVCLMLTDKRDIRILGVNDLWGIGAVTPLVLVWIHVEKRA